MDYRVMAESLVNALSALSTVARELAEEINKTGPVHPEVEASLQDAENIAKMARTVLVNSRKTDMTFQVLRGGKEL